MIGYERDWLMALSASSSTDEGKGLDGGDFACVGGYLMIL